MEVQLRVRGIMINENLFCHIIKAGRYVRTRSCHRYSSHFCPPVGRRKSSLLRIMGGMVAQDLFDRKAVFPSIARSTYKLLLGPFNTDRLLIYCLTS
ncbi:hypothetical protein NPIL_229891 [Nephila pilipes]|uniref:Uncharacterized protein n=1 Tax=Nephila pilipes TaxID=299642 RepID=A0A8X6T4M8_NEPPI|nr:hypothetical protein NPIL_229891 [Nephila pilipes]